MYWWIIKRPQCSNIRRVAPPDSIPCSWIWLATIGLCPAPAGPLGCRQRLDEHMVGYVKHHFFVC